MRKHTSHHGPIFTESPIDTSDGRKDYQFKSMNLDTCYNRDPCPKEGFTQQQHRQLRSSIDNQGRVAFCRTAAFDRECSPKRSDLRHGRNFPGCRIIVSFVRSESTREGFLVGTP
jgi:hypothetical protein